MVNTLNTLNTLLSLVNILKVGKLVVATNDLEEKRLLDLWERATQNNVSGLELVGPEGIREREPACQVMIACKHALNILFQ